MKYFEKNARNALKIFFFLTVGFFLGVCFNLINFQIRVGDSRAESPGVPLEDLSESDREALENLVLLL